MRLMQRLFFCVVGVAGMLLTQACATAESTATVDVMPSATSVAMAGRSSTVAGQTIYVPVYSHIYYQDRQRVINLTVTLSVRNADPEHGIWVDSVQYVDADGQLVRSELTAPHQLAPLASLEFVVEEDDTSGGSGASFLVQWSSEEPAVAPVVEAVMISAASTQGISFISPGRVIAEHSPSSAAPLPTE